LRPDMLRGAGVFLYPLWYYCLSFIPIDSVVSMILYTLLSVITPFLIHMLSCVDAYIWYCSVYDSF